MPHLHSHRQPVAPALPLRVRHRSVSGESPNDPRPATTPPGTRPQRASEQHRPTAGTGSSSRTRPRRPPAPAQLVQLSDGAYSRALAPIACPAHQSPSHLVGQQHQGRLPVSGLLSGFARLSALLSKHAAHTAPLGSVHRTRSSCARLAASRSCRSMLKARRSR